jgi:DNA-binding LytR/AlgR family response regulator
MGGFIKIQFSDIELVERMQGSYIKMHTRVGAFLLPGSLAAFIEKLPDNLFVRVSDGLILPVAEVSRINNKEYEFKGRKFKLTFRFAAAARKEIENRVEA